MKVIVLTTDTLHHAYFVRELVASGVAVVTVCETESLSAPFDTAHPFEQARDEYERELWFGGKPATLKSEPDVLFVKNINDPRVVELLGGEKSIANIVFGTRKIGAELVSASKSKLLNLHGGDPRFYRGLDSVLCAVYHGDFGQLKTCLHTVNAVLDDGEMVGLKPLSIRCGMQLHQVRAENARVCVSLVTEAIGSIIASEPLNLSRQDQVGRYYSFMPNVLKELCVKKFERHTAGLV